MKQEGKDAGGRAAKGTFAEFLRGAPKAGELEKELTVSGTVMRTEDENSFSFTSQDGQTVDLPTEAVVSHRILSEEGGQQLLELRLDAARLNKAQIDINKLRITNPVLDHYHTLKEMISDPMYDTIAIFDQRHTLKEMIKDPLFDTSPSIDIRKQPAYDTLAEQIGGIPDPDNTIQETVGGFPGIPGGDPSWGAAGGLTPFVMATPHHAPQAALAMQQLATSQMIPRPPYAKTVASEAVGGISSIKPIVDTVNTIKEIAKDPIRDTLKEVIKEPPFDTRKEMVQETVWEGTFTDPRDLLTNPVWGFPGLMY